MSCITYGKDQKELKATNPQAVEYMLVQRFKEMNSNSIFKNSNSMFEVSDKEVDKEVKVLIEAPEVKEFFKK